MSTVMIYSDESDNWSWATAHPHHSTALDASWAAGLPRATAMPLPVDDRLLEYGVDPTELRHEHLRTCCLTLLASCCGRASSSGRHCLRMGSKQLFELLALQLKLGKTHRSQRRLLPEHRHTPREGVLEVVATTICWPHTNRRRRRRRRGSQCPKRWQVDARGLKLVAERNHSLLFGPHLPRVLCCCGLEISEAL